MFSINFLKTPRRHAFVFFFFCTMVKSFSSISMAVFEVSLYGPSADEGVGEIAVFINCWWECKLAKVLEEQFENAE